MIFFIHIFILILNISNSNNLFSSTQNHYPEKQFIFSFISKIDDSTEVNCLVYLPEDYYKNPEEKYPLLIFLHGGAEAGNNIEKVKTNGPPKLVEEGKSFPFIIISPQLSRKITSDWDPKLVDEIYENIKKEFRIDEDRFYLTGISVGGAGTWKYALTHPEKVAAIAPICGWGDPPKACKMKDVPTWAFHGAKDRVINVNSTRNMVTALKNCGATPKLTIYPNAGHDSWTRTYENPALYKWLLSHSKSSTTIKFKSKKGALEKHNNKTDSKQDLKQQTSRNSINLVPLNTLPASLHESSGLIVLNKNSFWTHNDSGNLPVLFNIDSTGNILQIKRITNATNFDWEDIAKDQNDNLYIGDFGNNKNNRRFLQIYKIPNPENIAKERIKAEVIAFSFPDQKQFPPPAISKNFNIEAMVCFKNSLYLFSKNLTNPYTGYCKLYRLPNTPGNYTAELLDSVFLGNSIFEASITGGTISEDYEHLALLSYNKIFTFSCFKEDDFFSGNKMEFNFPYLSQREAIAFNDNALYFTDEKFQGFGGNIYFTSMDNYFKQSCP